MTMLETRSQAIQSSRVRRGFGTMLRLAIGRVGRAERTQFDSKTQTFIPYFTEHTDRIPDETHSIPHQLVAPPSSDQPSNPLL